MKKVFCYSYDSWIPSSECDQEPEPAPVRTKAWEVNFSKMLYLHKIFLV